MRTSRTTPGCSHSARRRTRRIRRTWQASTLRSSARRSTSSFSDRPGARFGPRAIRAASCPPGSHLEVAIDAFAALRIVDYGDAPVIPAEPLLSHEAVERLVGEVVDAGALPIVLGGDHSIAEPDVRAVAARHGAVGLVHFDTHTDTGSEVFGAERSHGTPMYRLVEDGHVDPRRYVQIGLRGYWPTEREFAWQAERGITSLFMHDVRARSGRRRARSGRWIPRAADRPRHVGADEPGPGGNLTAGPEEVGRRHPARLGRPRPGSVCRVENVYIDGEERRPVPDDRERLLDAGVDPAVAEILTGLALARR